MSLANSKNDYKINGLVKEGEISFFKKNKLEKINFIFNIEENIFNFKDISFDANNINFLSDRLDINKDKKNYLLEGSLRNKKSLLNDQILQVIKLKYPQIDLINTEFESKNDFTFNINDKFKVKNLSINSSILINNSQLKRNNLIDKNIVEINEFIDLKDHEIKASYANKKLSIEGKGQVKLQNKFELINYKANNNGSNLNLLSNIELSELNIKNQNLIKEYLPKTKDTLNLKDHKIQINYQDNILALEGFGKIKFEKELNQIKYVINAENDVKLINITVHSCITEGTNGNVYIDVDNSSKFTNSDSVIIKNCTFTTNTTDGLNAGDYPGIKLNGGSWGYGNVLIENTKFIRNSNAYGTLSSGRMVYVYKFNKLNIKKCYFTDNDNSGYVMYVNGTGAIDAYTPADPNGVTIENCVFDNNDIKYNAIYFRQCKGTISNSTFAYNTSTSVYSSIATNVDGYTSSTYYERVPDFKFYNCIFHTTDNGNYNIDEPNICLIFII